MRSSKSASAWFAFLFKADMSCSCPECCLVYPKQITLMRIVIFNGLSSNSAEDACRSQAISSALATGTDVFSGVLREGPQFCSDLLFD